MDDFDYVELCLDSLDASNAGSGVETSLNWPVFQFTRTLNNVAALKVLEATLPYSFYQITPLNGTFVLDEVTASASLTLPPGNYSTNSMADTLATLLSAHSPSNYVYVVNYSTQTSNLSITNSTTGEFSVIFGDSEDTGQLNPRLMLGLGPGVTSSVLIRNYDTIITGALKMTSNYLYVNSRAIGTLVNLYLPQGAKNLSVGEVGPQLAKIPINSEANGTILYVDPCPQKWFPIENLSSFTAIDFFCTLGNTSPIIDFNGQSFSVKLGLLIKNNAYTEHQGATYDQGRIRTRITPI